MTSPAHASPAQVWQQAMQMAAAGHGEAAIAHLSGAASMIPNRHDLWRERMLVAAALLDMREKQRAQVDFPEAPEFSGWAEVRLVRRYLAGHPPPVTQAPYVAGMAAALFPGAGHAWQGRWRDAGVAALLVWPMLVLTLWAARRRMGPVTVFFALITVWLWSGTVFSAVSLAERGNVEAYLYWWQGLWQASGLPGRPW